MKTRHPRVRTIARGGMRLSESEHKLITRARKTLGLSLSDFVVRCANEMIAEMAHDEPVLRYRGHILDVTRDGDMHYVHVCGGWDVTCSDALFTAREAATSEQAIENAMSAIDVTIQSMSSGTLNTQGEK